LARSAGADVPLELSTVDATYTADDLRVFTEMAEDFADGVQENTVTVSAIQGYLMRHKTKPRQAISESKEWIRDGFRQETIAAIEAVEDTLLS
jgi:hypothetical protein